MQLKPSKPHMILYFQSYTNFLLFFITFYLSYARGLVRLHSKAYILHNILDISKMVLENTMLEKPAKFSHIQITACKVAPAVILSFKIVIYL